MKPKTKRWLRAGLYPLAYLGFFAVSARLTFPYAQVKERLVTEFNAHQPATGGMRLAVRELTGRWLTGIEARGVQLTQIPVLTSGSVPTSDKNAPKPRVSELESVWGSVSLLRLLTGTLSLSFGAASDGGSVDGSYVSSSSEDQLAVSFDGFGLGDIPLLSDLVGLPLAGKINGELELTLPEHKANKAEGKLELKLDGVAAGDGKAKILNVIALPQLRVGTFNIAAKVTDGKLKIDSFSAKGADVEVAGDGTIRLREPVGTSLLDIGLRFKFNDAYKNKNDLTRGIFGQPGGIPGLFEMDPKVRRSKREDGFYGWRAIGSFDLPSFEPSATAGGSRGVAPRLPARRPGSVSAD